MQKRVQSPSSIKTYKLCPRKYYYSYIRKLATIPTIHLVRGQITHKVLENFFNINVNELSEETFENQLKIEVQKLLVQHWKDSSSVIDALNLSSNQKIFYFEETMLMLFNWVDGFIRKLKSRPEPVQEAFQVLTPKREINLVSSERSVRGIIDAVQEIDGKVHILDYKTSSTFDLNEHKLQLAIYALLYQEKYGKLPDKLGVYYLKVGEQFINIDQSLLDMADKEIKLMHEKTKSQDIKDYPKNIGSWCKWSAGKCDFYENCIKE
ncbi:PD-(D/E)XK nuclease family protein [Candidatus Woesearchaeota archaeon]|nr:PD-(D/E)XK nuclease family protein [Candidatus Woesearchaeota archaeon]